MIARMMMATSREITRITFTFMSLFAVMVQFFFFSCCSVVSKDSVSAIISGSVHDEMFKSNKDFFSLRREPSLKLKLIFNL